MTRKNKRYDKDFKLEATKLVVEHYRGAFSHRSFITSHSAGVILGIAMM
jgi:hypothetical protein